MKILTARQMREVDRITIEKLGVPGPLLMENAGRNVFEVLREKFPSLSRERITILCGKGNNGGDGFVVARHLYQRGFRPEVILLAEPQSLKGDARLHYDILLQAGLQPVVARHWNEWSALRAEIGLSTLLVDAILGTGLEGPVEGFYGEVIRDLNAHFSVIPMVAVDMPSGLPSDTGETFGESLRARYTVTFTAPKWSHVFPPNCERIGELIVTPIGTPPSVYEDDPAIFLNLLEAREMAAMLGRRRSDSHKGDYGHVLVVAGSMGKSGAAALTALGALSAGAGLVTAAVPSSVLPVVTSVAPTLMTEPLAETDAGTISPRAFDYGRFAAIARGKTVLALGPGLSAHPETVQFVRKLLSERTEDSDKTDTPVVVDADGLNAFAGAVDLLRGEGRKLILTPHPGEMARLTGLNTKEIQARRVELAR
ncbi:MAG: NAD(P)H-hydrate epimerase, partial [Acidobacteria bacterium]|nr:NAD(P)H-hydrate epimerase [Acidobacteriota bacterium]